MLKYAETDKRGRAMEKAFLEISPLSADYCAVRTSHACRCRNLGSLLIISLVQSWLIRIHSVGKLE